MIQYRLGSARKAWVSRTHFGFVSPLGDSHLVRRRVFELRQGWEGLEDRDKRRVSSERIARLTGRNAVLHVGGNTQRAIDQRLARAAQATNVLRAASTTGVLPGGGLALLNCRRSLAGYCDEAFELEAKLARAILTSALEAPVRQLALNAGQEPSLAVEIASERPDCALDPTDIIINCVHRAIEGAAQALTINGVVLHRSPDLAAS
jgi:chaperonin GroEL